MTTIAARINSLAEFASADGGILLVDKPAGWTSFDVIRKLRGLLRIRKVGHAGTLDPLATGLLILASQKMTVKIDAFQALPKAYEGTMTLGGVTASYDAATPVTDPRSPQGITEEAVRDAARKFTGEIDQIPPMFSAVKHHGRRLYSYARKGEEVERNARRITVREFEITGIDMPVVSFRVLCSKGTYVRSLVHDAGQSLGCGAWLSSLRRTAIGEFSVNDAWTMDGLAERMSEIQEAMKGNAGS
jgi:tRNA pseudouridine55 synthase